MKTEREKSLELKLSVARDAWLLVKGALEAGHTPHEKLERLLTEALVYEDTAIQSERSDQC